jgi:hypothetical protein
MSRTLVVRSSGEDSLASQAFHSPLRSSLEIPATRPVELPGVPFRPGTRFQPRDPRSGSGSGSAQPLGPEHHSRVRMCQTHALPTGKQVN